MPSRISARATRSWSGGWTGSVAQTHQLVGLLEQCGRDGVKLRSLQDGIDPSSTMGKAMLQIGAVSAEMERHLIRERTNAGLAAARARGRLGGGKPRIGTDALDAAKRLMKDPDLTVGEIAKRLGATESRSIGHWNGVPVFSPEKQGEKRSGA